MSFGVWFLVVRGGKGRKYTNTHTKHHMVSTSKRNNNEKQGRRLDKERVVVSYTAWFREGFSVKGL